MLYPASLALSTGSATGVVNRGGWFIQTVSRHLNIIFYFQYLPETICCLSIRSPSCKAPFSCIDQILSICIMARCIANLHETHNMKKLLTCLVDKSTVFAYFSTDIQCLFSQESHGLCNDSGGDITRVWICCFSIASFWLTS